MILAKIRTMVIDDSALMRQVLTELLQGDPEIEVIGTAPDPYVAREKIKVLNPDVLTLDVEMPRMDGISFLRNLMRLRPMPVVMVSSLTERGAEITMQALELGAVDFVTKPKIDVAHGLRDYADELIAKVKAAARVSRSTLESVGRLSAAPQARTARPAGTGMFRTTHTILAIGASTGGTEAIKQVLMQLPADAPPTVIAQHIPEGFSASFAKRLDGLCAMRVRESAGDEQLIPGHAYIAPGHSHLQIHRDGARYVTRLDQGAPVNRHRPSVEVLFDSVTRYAGQNAVAVMLTGMGTDGARAMVRLREAGARTIVQDEKSSIVWGMPGEAAKLGAAEYILPLDTIAAKILELTTTTGNKTA